jgi:hypothetical protein
MDPGVRLEFPGLALTTTVFQANWVIPPDDVNGARYDGTVVLSKGVFLEGWLLDKLQNVCHRTTYVATEAKWWSGWDGILPVNYRSIKGRLGLEASDPESPKAILTFDPDASKNGKRVWNYKVWSEIHNDHGLWRVWHKGKSRCLKISCVRTG